MPDAFSEADYSVLGNSANTFMGPAARAAVKDRLGLTETPTSDRLLPLIVEVMGFHADPDAAGGRNPLMPTHKGEYELHIGPMTFRRRWDGLPEGRIWDRIKVTLRRIYAQIKAENPTLAAKWAEAMRRKLRVAFSEIADPGDVAVEPETIKGDTFTDTALTLLSAHTATGPNGGFSWVAGASDGVTDINASNQLSVGAGMPADNIWRAEADLSSSDMETQFDYVDVDLLSGATGSRVGPVCRYSASANTFYSASGFTNGTQRIRIDSYVAGTPTQIDNTSVTFSLPDLLKLETSGSTISSYLNGSVVGSVTDTTTAGNTRGGLISFLNGFNTRILDNWQAQDLVAAGHPAMRRLGGIRYARPVEIGREGVRVF